MKDDFELGYTPNNLRKIRTKYELTLANVAEMLNVGLRTVQRWESGLEVKTHRDMPCTKWFELIDKLNDK